MKDGFADLKKNQETFDRCHALLSKNQTIVIFAEASSRMVKKLRPIQKGAARIALGAMEKYELDEVYISTVAVNFEHPEKQGGYAYIQFGESIKVSEHFELYKQDAKSSLDNISKEIYSKLKPNMIHLDDLKHTDLFDRCNQIITDQEDSPIFPLIKKDNHQFIKRKNLSDNINSGKIPEIDASPLGVKFVTRPGVLVKFFNFLLLVWTLPFQFVVLWPAWLAFAIAKFKIKSLEFRGPVRIGITLFFYALYLFALMLLLPVFNVEQILIFFISVPVFIYIWKSFGYKTNWLRWDTKYSQLPVEEMKTQMTKISQLL